MKHIDLEKYTEFVKTVTSKESNYLDAFVNRVNYLDKNHTNLGPNGDFIPDPKVNAPLLLTAALGLGSESGEFIELVKKVFFQTKPLSEDVRYHMMRELGDVIWYWTNACRALELDPNEVIAENVKKLASRYPGGEFDPYYSENRKEGDI